MAGVRRIKHSELPANLLPYVAFREARSWRNVCTEIVDSGDQLTDTLRQITCRKAYHFICSAHDECQQDILIYTKDARKAERLARDRGWSFLKEIGWTCHQCAAIYHHPMGRIGPNRKRRKTVQALTSREQKHRRLTLQEFWQIQLEQERRGNDLAERRDP